MSATPESLKPRRVGFHTFGCRSNYADTVELETLLAAKGMTPCSIDSMADAYVVNTCTVTDEADKEVVRLLAKLRKKAPESRIIVTGCMAEVAKDRLLATGLVDDVIGTGERNSIVAALTEAETETQPLINVGPGEYLGEVRSRARFHLRIQDGCEEACTYCIIPKSRGAFRSRSIDEILADIARLSGLGYAEIVLTGTHIGGYGEDCGSSLLELLTAIAERGASSRIRLSSVDPNDLSQEIISLMSRSHVFCRHLHICVQAFSDGILKRMNRRYRMADVHSLLCYIAQELPGCGIGSDVICGFPGECREDVEQEIETFLSLPFSYLHVFPYSERTDTAATRLTGSVDLAERRRRAARWRTLSERREREFHERFVGAELEIVIEGSRDEFVHGTSREFVGARLENVRPGELKIGSAVKVKAVTYDSEKRTLICQA